MAPSLSPDGKWIVYAKRGGEQTDIFLQAVGGENAINLTKNSGGGGEQPSFSPDGEQIAFRSQRQGGGLFVMGRTGELARRLSELGYSPSWSPDGEWLTYSTSAAGDFPSAHPGGAELWVVNISTGEKSRLSVDDALQPVWSPDNKWIAFWGIDSTHHQRDIWTVPIRGGQPARVTNDASTEVSPSWSPNGRYLYFSSDRSGPLNLWRVQIDGSTGGARGVPEAVIAPNVNAVHANLSRNGQRLVLRSRTYLEYGRVFGPIRSRAAGSARQTDVAPRRIAPLDGCAHVSPDGSQLALVRWSQQQDLFLFATDRGSLRRLTSDRLGVPLPGVVPRRRSNRLHAEPSD